jgi:hypothetical protein
MKFDTDKHSHGYIPIYEEYFQKCENVKNILEIGIGAGESLKYLNNYFPNANVYGIDIQDRSFCDSDKIKTFIYNQESREDLSKFLELTNIEFDIIIDDGGHTMKQQQISLGFLFKSVKKGGLYILEDLHTSIWSAHLRHGGWFITENDDITTLDMLNNFNNNKNMLSNHILPEERVLLENEIESIFIWSRTPDYDESVTSIIKKK